MLNRFLLPPHVSVKAVQFLLGKAFICQSQCYPHHCGVDWGMFFFFAVFCLLQNIWGLSGRKQSGFQPVLFHCFCIIKTGSLCLVCFSATGGRRYKEFKKPRTWKSAIAPLNVGTFCFEMNCCSTVLTQPQIHYPSLTHLHKYTH